MTFGKAHVLNTDVHFRSQLVKIDTVAPIGLDWGKDIKGNPLPQSKKSGRSSRSSRRRLTLFSPGGARIPCLCEDWVVGRWKNKYVPTCF